MNRIKITNTATETTLIADVLSRSDKKIRAVIQGTDLPLDFSRTDVRLPYVYNGNRMTLETNGKDA